MIQIKETVEIIDANNKIITAMLLPFKMYRVGGTKVQTLDRDIKDLILRLGYGWQIKEV